MFVELSIEVQHSKRTPLLVGADQLQEPLQSHLEADLREGRAGGVLRGIGLEGDV